MNIITWVTSHWQEIGSAVALIIASARIIVKLTPTPTDDSVLDKIVTVLKHVGLQSDAGQPKN